MGQVYRVHKKIKHKNFVNQCLNQIKRNYKSNEIKNINKLENIIYPQWLHDLDKNYPAGHIYSKALRLSRKLWKRKKDTIIYNIFGWHQQKQNIKHNSTINKIDNLYKMFIDLILEKQKNKNLSLFYETQDLFKNTFDLITTIYKYIIKIFDFMNHYKFFKKPHTFGDPIEAGDYFYGVGCQTINEINNIQSKKVTAGRFEYNFINLSFDLTFNKLIKLTPVVSVVSSMCTYNVKENVEPTVNKSYNLVPFYNLIEFDTERVVFKVDSEPIFVYAESVGKNNKFDLGSILQLLFILSTYALFIAYHNAEMEEKVAETVNRIKRLNTLNFKNKKDVIIHNNDIFFDRGVPKTFVYFDCSMDQFWRLFR
jgi:hypothetical protein